MDRCGDRPVDGVAGGRAGGAGTLSLQHIHNGLVLTSATVLIFLTKKSML